jgi:hypothetical protein
MSRPSLPYTLTEGDLKQLGIVARWLVLLRGFINDISRNYEIATSVTAAYTALEGDCFILGDATAGAFAVTLPAVTAVREGKKYIVRKTDATANNVTITSASTINNNAALNAQWMTRTYINDGSAWQCY